MKQQQIRNYKLRKLTTLIHEVSDLYGGDDEEFLDSYIAQVIKYWSNTEERLFLVMRCFEELKVSALSAGKIPAPTQDPWPRIRGSYPALFKDYYDELEQGTSGGANEQPELVQKG